MEDRQTAALGAKMSAVIDLANHRLADTAAAWRRDYYQVILRCFEGLRISLYKGRLPERFATGTRLWAFKAISEWDLGDDEMRQAVLDAEDYYRNGS